MAKRVAEQKGKIKIVPTMKEMSENQNKAADRANAKKRASGMMPKISKKK